MQAVNRRTTHGFSLIEVMISITLGMVLTTSVISVYSNTVKSNNYNVDAAYLTQDVKASLNLIAMDVRRTGYWKNAKTNIMPTTTLFLSSKAIGNSTITDSNSADIFDNLGGNVVGLQIIAQNGAATISSKTDSNTIETSISNDFDSSILSEGTWGIQNPFGLIQPSNSTPVNCILFTHDVNGDNTVDNNEKYGYRLNNNRIQTYISGTHDCNNGTWEDISDDRTKITSLNFTLQSDTVDLDDTGPGTSSVEVRSVQIDISAELNDDASISRTFNQKIRLMNDRFIP